MSQGGGQCFTSTTHSKTKILLLSPIRLLYGFLVCAGMRVVATQANFRMPLTICKMMRGSILHASMKRFLLSSPGSDLQFQSLI